MNVEYIVVHASATKPGMNVDAAWIDREHRKRGFRKIGYHLFIRRDGVTELGRDIGSPGAHVSGYNHNSVGICMAGGINDNGQPEDNFTDDQKLELARTLLVLRKMFPKAKIVGHRDLSPDLNGDGRITPNEFMKSCPCFDVRDFCDEVGLVHTPI